MDKSRFRQLNHTLPLFPTISSGVVTPFVKLPSFLGIGAPARLNAVGAKQNTTLLTGRRTAADLYDVITELSAE